MTTAADLNHAYRRFIRLVVFVADNTYPHRNPPLCRAKYNQAVRLRARARARYKATLAAWKREHRGPPLWTSESVYVHDVMHGSRYSDNVVKHAALDE